MNEIGIERLLSAVPADDAADYTRLVAEDAQGVANHVKTARTLDDAGRAAQ